jgi:hypothetical protein
MSRPCGVAWRGRYLGARVQHTCALPPRHRGAHRCEGAGGFCRARLAPKGQR